jgi:hypothetical protein
MDKSRGEIDGSQDCRFVFEGVSTDSYEGEKSYLNKLGGSVKAVTKCKRLMAGQQGLGRWIVRAVWSKTQAMSRRTAVSA